MYRSWLIFSIHKRYNDSITTITCVNCIQSLSLSTGTRRWPKTISFIILDPELLHDFERILLILLPIILASICATLLKNSYQQWHQRLPFLPLKFATLSQKLHAHQISLWSNSNIFVLIRRHLITRTDIVCISITKLGMNSDVTVTSETLVVQG